MQTEEIEDMKKEFKEMCEERRKIEGVDDPQDVINCLESNVKLKHSVVDFKGCG